jgi:UDP-GlcNAc3NAcA epimerase
MSADLASKLESNMNIILTEPLSFLDMVEMESCCDFVVTDSGGVQKEAFFFQKPCIILRDQTEWVELVSNGNAILTGANKEKIVMAYKALVEKESAMTWPAFFGDGKASEFICQTIFDYLHS